MSTYAKSVIRRRDFLYFSVLSSSALVVDGCGSGKGPSVLESDGVIGGLKKEEGVVPIQGAAWYEAGADGDGLTYSFSPGILATAKYLTCDMLLDGNETIVFLLTLREGEKGRAFTFRFFGLNQCGLRMRLPLTLVDQNRWGIEREGAFLKPRCGGDRVDRAKVDRMTFQVMRKGPRQARWCMTGIAVAEDEVPRMQNPALPKGRLVDEMGQSTIREWASKSRGVEEVAERIRKQLRDAPKQVWPASFSRWGGWKAKRLGKASGFFRTQKDGKRWWLVDPDGHAFWSAGLDCVRVDCYARFDGLESVLNWLPEPDGEFKDAFDSGTDLRREGRYINYMATNFIRAAGSANWRDKWAAVALAELRRLRFNTVGNWSEWEFARKAQTPYVRPLSFQPRRIGLVYRDFPDVFHADFEKEAEQYAAQLKDTATDPALIGYFLMNEPQWGFSSELPAAGMLFVTPNCETRKELARFLKQKYPDDAALSKGWGIETTFERIAAGPWSAVLPEAALTDLQAFSILMTERYFKTISAACRKADPNHLNLGVRWAGPPPMWAVEGMKSFDVFSMNCYRQKVPPDVTRKIHDLLKIPVIIGEWHFGALDAGLPSSGIGHLRNQADRAKAYRIYLEDAAANPACVGAHWFTLYDQSALGRFDGENYNIGFLDVCNRPYEELGNAAIASHERMYEVALGRKKPFNEPIEYLPNLY